jgi:hypothetical protein
VSFDWGLLAPVVFGPTVVACRLGVVRWSTACSIFAFLVMKIKFRDLVKRVFVALFSIGHFGGAQGEGRGGKKQSLSN